MKRVSRILNTVSPPATDRSLRRLASQWEGLPEEVRQWKDDTLQNKPSEHQVAAPMFCDTLSVGPLKRFLSFIPPAVSGEHTALSEQELELVFGQGEPSLSNGQDLLSFSLTGHWLYFLFGPLTSELALDGYVSTEQPPPPFGPRMWAGGKLDYHAPLTVGGAYRLEQRVADVQLKRGRNGRLMFVVMEHRIFPENSSSEQPCLVEQQRFVYKEIDPMHDAKPVPFQRRSNGVRQAPVPEFVAKHSFSGVDLMRFSMLTHNAHRIHWDVPYCQQEEGYPGAVVHGPLSCSMALRHLQRCIPSHMRVSSFDYKNISPAFADELLSFECGPRNSSPSQWGVSVRLEDGTLIMDGVAEITARS